MGYMYQNDMQLAAMTRSMQEASAKCVTMGAYGADRDYARTLKLQADEIAKLSEENRRLRMSINILKGRMLKNGDRI